MSLFVAKAATAAFFAVVSRSSAAAKSSSKASLYFSDLGAKQRMDGKWMHIFSGS